MNHNASTSKQNVDTFEDDEIFEDSSILANFNNTSFNATTARPSEGNINDSLNRSELNISALCCDEEISGYDKLTGRTWIYPTNYPVRQYQFNIINSAILNNTLVSLPTGLGKTFIAAVIMYNFYRWYPLGKIVFTAPTRPLVAQQIEACYNIVAIPPNDTVEMTGHMLVNTRKTHWQSKRVFFATPQVIYNDIKSGICPGDKIRCLVIDEAHRAKGNYAYCQIVGTLTDMGHKTYRILALSATPGSKVEDVVSVVKNLHIAHLELRTENCLDVAPYSHARQINTVIVQLGPELSQLRQQYVEILDSYARNLKDMNILPHNLGNLSKGRIMMLYKDFQNRERGARHPKHNYIMKDFTLLIALFHGLELLVKHGSRVFLNFFDEHPEKSWIQADDRLTSLLERLRDYLGVNPSTLNTSILPDGTVPEIPKNLSFGHPKFNKLKEIMMDHFKRSKEKGQDTRAIVFCEYRESVNLVHCLLLQCRPLITPQMFVGQGASGKDGKTVISQKQQLRVMRSFREGACNTLVATCVAEEGLDVGSVDLIVCFDISTRSPIRLVQRCGRTGRERGGQVFILVTEGREHQTLMDCMRQRDGLNKKILQSREVHSSLYTSNPRMLPRDLTPQCQKMYITVEKKDSKDKGNASDKNKKGQKDLRTMLLGRGSSSGSSTSSKELENLKITEEEFNQIYPDGYRDSSLLKEPKEYWTMSKEAVKATSGSEETHQIKLYTWLEWQRTLQKTVNIGHSKDTEILSQLLQYSDAKRFEMPTSTQNPSFHTQDFASQNIFMQSPAKISSSPGKLSSPLKILSPSKPKQTKKKPKIPLIKSPGKKGGDIRALFSTATKSTKTYTKFITDLGIQNDGSIPTRLINLLVDLSLDNTNSTRQCYICQNLCNCELIKKFRTDVKQPMRLSFIKEPKFPDLDLIDDINAESILKCANDVDRSNISIDQDIIDLNIDYQDDNKNSSRNFDLEFDFDSPIDLSSPDNKETKVNFDEEEDKNFDIGDIEDIFVDSSPDEGIAKVIKAEQKNSSDPKEALGFFGLDSIDDIFADSEDDIENKTTKTPEKASKVKNVKSNITVVNPVSPSILSGKPKVFTSPILCSQARKPILSMKKKHLHSSTPTSNLRRQLIPDTTNNNDIMLTPDDHKFKSSLMQSSMADTSNKSMMTITQIVEHINKNNDSKNFVNDSSQCNAFRETENQINVNKEDEIIVSPILLTQADRKKSLNQHNDSLKSDLSTTSQSKRPVSLIILESDSDSDNDTQVYEAAEKVDGITNNEFNFMKSCLTPDKSQSNIEKRKHDSEQKSKESCSSLVSRRKHDSEQKSKESCSSLVSSKRKLEFEEDDVINNSPYFNKKQKVNDGSFKPLTLQEKILATLSSSKMNKDSFSNDKNVNYVFTSPKTVFQKENKIPQLNSSYKESDDEKDHSRKSNLEMLQKFKSNKVKSPIKKLCLRKNSPTKTKLSQKRKITFDDSDEDFVDRKDDYREERLVNGNHKNNADRNHKVRKKKKKGNEFLDLEAELSDDADCESGDELSDDSIGSIVDFICDDTVANQEDMHALYIKSIKSPVKGVFKIPELPNKYDKELVFSQFVEEDNYEMDSFCVDSHVGLTQVNEYSELELAEMILEERRGKKKSSARTVSEENNESPIVKRKHKNLRRIHSDSEDSS